MGNAVKHLRPQNCSRAAFTVWGPFPNPEFIVRLCELCDTRRRVRAAIPFPTTTRKSGHGRKRPGRSLLDSLLQNALCHTNHYHGSKPAYIVHAH